VPCALLGSFADVSGTANFSKGSAADALNTHLSVVRRSTRAAWFTFKSPGV
jgi:hypothetical protein